MLVDFIDTNDCLNCSGSIVFDLGMIGTSFALFLALFSVAALVPGCCGSIRVKGSSVVKNDYLFEGEPLEMNCTIDPSETVTASDIYFKESRNNVSSKNFSVINYQTATLKITPPSNRTTICIRYACFVKKVNIPFSDKCIFVEKSPRAILESDLRCLVEDWKNMTCVIDLGVIYREIKNIKVTLEWSRDYNCKNWSLCPHGNKTSCTWIENDGNDSMNFQNYCIKINVTNTKRDVTAFYRPILVDPTQHVKPSPVTQLSMVANSSQCVNISWKHTSIRNKTYTIQMEQVDGHFIKNITTKLQTAEICDLKPYTEYQVSVYCLPSGIYNGYPSNGVTKLVETLQDVPDQSPSIYHGFEELNSPNTTCRLIQLWHQAEGGRKNGEITQYSVTISRVGDESQLYSQVFDKIPSEICLPPDKNYHRIILNSGTSVGFSNKPSSIVIVPKSEVSAMELPLFHIEFISMTQNSASLIKVFLDAELNPPVNYSYTLVYCKGTLMDKCKNAVHAETLSANQSVEIPGGLNTNYIFGLSVQMEVNGEVISSGIQWARCLYKENGEIKIPPKNFRYQQFSDSFEVLWDKYSCNSLETTAFVKGYIIIYCLTNDKTNCTGERKKIKTKNPIENHVMVNESDLQPGANYFIEGRAFSMKSSSPMSRRLLVTIPDNDSNMLDPVLISVILGGIIFVILIAGILSHKIRKWLKKTDLTTGITVPELGELIYETEISENIAEVRELLVPPHNNSRLRINEETSMDDRHSDSVADNPLDVLQSDVPGYSSVPPYNRMTNDTFLQPVSSPDTLSIVRPAVSMPLLNSHPISFDNVEATMMPVQVSDKNNADFNVTQIPSKIKNLTKSKSVSQYLSLTNGDSDGKLCCKVAPMFQTLTHSNQCVPSKSIIPVVTNYDNSYEYFSDNKSISSNSNESLAPTQVLSPIQDLTQSNCDLLKEMTDTISSDSGIKSTSSVANMTQTLTGVNGYVSFQSLASATIDNISLSEDKESGSVDECNSDNSQEMDACGSTNNIS